MVNARLWLLKFWFVLCGYATCLAWPTLKITIGAAVASVCVTCAVAMANWGLEVYFQVRQLSIINTLMTMGVTALAARFQWHPMVPALAKPAIALVLIAMTRAAGVMALIPSFMSVPMRTWCYVTIRGFNVIGWVKDTFAFKWTFNFADAQLGGRLVQIVDAQSMSGNMTTSGVATAAGVSTIAAFGLFKKWPGR